jgi:hypothetical protein
MHATYRPDNPVTPYLPYYRRLLVRTAAIWLVLRVVLEASAARLEPVLDLGPQRPLHPLAALGLIGFVLAIDAVNARAMREAVFRANAGVSTRRVMLLTASVLLGLEAAFRVVT